MKHDNEPQSDQGKNSEHTPVSKWKEQVWKKPPKK